MPLVGMMRGWRWGRCRTFLEYGPLAPSMVTRVADGPEHCPVMAQETCSQPSTETLHSLWDDGLTHDFWSHGEGCELRDRVQPQSAPAKVVKSSSTSLPLTVTTTLGCSPAALR